VGGWAGSRAAAAAAQHTAAHTESPGNSGFWLTPQPQRQQLAPSKKRPICKQQTLKRTKRTPRTESPGKSGFWLTISAKMQPMLHRSTGVE
jgi:hypothetical protein